MSLIIDRESREMRGPGFWRQVMILLIKDLRIELRSMEIVSTTSLLGMLIVVVSSFALRSAGHQSAGVGPGLLWISIVFCGILAIGHFCARERETIRALLIAGIRPAAFFFAKLTIIVLFISVATALQLPLVIHFFDLKIAFPRLLFSLFLAGVVGFASVGSFFSAALIGARNRDALLAIIALPLTMPCLIAGAKGTAALMADRPELKLALTWLKLACAFDLVFISLSLWALGPLLRDD